MGRSSMIADELPPMTRASCSKRNSLGSQRSMTAIVRALPCWRQFPRIHYKLANLVVAHSGLHRTISIPTTNAAVFLAMQRLVIGSMAAPLAGRLSSFHPSNCRILTAKAKTRWRDLRGSREV